MTTEAEVLEALRYRCICSCLAELDEPVFILRAQDISRQGWSSGGLTWLRRPKSTRQSARCFCNR
jgi:hypothetical protein